MKYITLAVVGSPKEDVRRLFYSFTVGGILPEYIPPVEPGEWGRVFRVWDYEIVMKGYEIATDLEKATRKVLYTGIDIFVICFSLVLPATLEEVRTLWVPEIKESRPDTPYILVGMNSEARDSFKEHAEECRNKGWETISTSTGEETKEAIGARFYVECSVKQFYNTNEVFETAVQTILPEPDLSQRKKKDCQIA
jgi:Ras-related C3 botulinum toxin substrate 1